MALSVYIPMVQKKQVVGSRIDSLMKKKSKQIKYEIIIFVIRTWYNIHLTSSENRLA
jgi:hypothetical protein